MTPVGDQKKPQAELRIRPAEWKDGEGIKRVLKRNGMGDLDLTLWRESAEAYPFAEEFRDIPIGWVLETGEGAIVGNLTNVHTLYEFSGKRLRGVVAAGWAVDPEHRRKSLRLMTTFFKQKGIDLWLNVSANPVTAEVLTSMKVARIPIPDYGIPCFWAVRPHAFARAALQRKSIPGADALAWPAGLLLLAGDILLRSGRGRLSSPVRRLPSFDDRFDALWQSISAGRPRLRAIRTRPVLDWRFRAELREGRIAILAAERAGALTGYAVLVRRPGTELGMQLYDIADIQSVADDPETLTDLLLASVKAAREDGMDAVKFMSGTPAKRLPAVKLRPYTYHLPFWQQYFVPGSPELGAALATADAWDFSFFDSF